MPAPKGNKNAQKGADKKSSGYHWRLSPEQLAALKNLAQAQQVKMAELLEIALLRTFPDDLKNIF